MHGVNVIISQASLATYKLEIFSRLGVNAFRIKNGTCTPNLQITQLLLSPCISLLKRKLELFKHQLYPVSPEVDVSDFIYVVTNTRVKNHLYPWY